MKSKVSPMVAPTLDGEAVLGLALALVQSSTAPVLLLDGDLNVLAASASFSRTFGLDPAGIIGRPVFALGHGEWDVPQLRSLLTTTVTGAAEVDAYELDLQAPGEPVRRLVLNARNLSYGAPGTVRLMLTLADVTDARDGEALRDRLVLEKGVLLQELQHRVANSLQIIASVILQTARKAQSDETRMYLTDAHSRVMSVAELQRQLSETSVGDVELRVYFTALCNSIGASMIRDPGQIALSVDADESHSTADVSVSLGLIVTELVINSLKHAFPDGASGGIIVRYRSEGPDWTLSVTDNGVGLPKDPADAEPGLGTSIVRALAQQLKADITAASANPGTTVSISHREPAPGAASPKPATLAV